MARKSAKNFKSLLKIFRTKRESTDRTNAKREIRLLTRLCFHARLFVPLVCARTTVYIFFVLYSGRVPGKPAVEFTLPFDSVVLFSRRVIVVTIVTIVLTVNIIFY